MSRNSNNNKTNDNYNPPSQGDFSYDGVSLDCDSVSTGRNNA